MVQAAGGERTPRPLDDLDVPYGVGCTPPALEAQSTGRRLGEWAGMVLVFWTADEARPKGLAAQRRKHGPKVVT